ncbi:MAG: 2-hydroxyacyl-CoA dehydratase family protein [Deltaproteobacteria bacterium]|nr:2-hydroxyacyl-CoA dehydratase family protein [Deltaproteobacteria bacterium]
MNSPHLAPFLDALSMEPARNSVSKGGKAIGYFCTYTPVEMIHAAGFTPVRVGGGIAAVTAADALTPNFICPFMRVALERALAGEYRFLSGIVQGYTCDVACGLVHIWEENIGGEIYHTVPLPYNDSPAARDFLRASLQELAAKLKAAGGCMSDGSLNRSLALYGKIRKTVMELYELRQSGKLPLSGADFYRVLQAGFVTPPEDYLVMAERLRDQAADTDETDTPRGIPILISGSLVEVPEIVAICEDAGGAVVADDLCTGYRWFSHPEGEGHDPMERLIDRYMKRIPCPSRTRAEERIPCLVELVSRSGARGVVFLLQKFCTPHLADHPVLVKALKERGIPSLFFEMEETGIMEGQLRTRLESFFQVIG